MTVKTSDLDEELRKLDPAGAPRISTVTIRNMTSPQREAMIVGAGVHFFYHGEQDYLAGPVRIAIAPGALSSFASTDPRRKVRAVAVGVSVRFAAARADKQPTYLEYFGTFDASKDTKDERDCIVDLTFDFIARPTCSSSASTAKEWFELRHRKDLL